MLQLRDLVGRRSLAIDSRAATCNYLARSTHKITDSRLSAIGTVSHVARPGAHGATCFSSFGRR